MLNFLQSRCGSCLNRTCKQIAISDVGKSCHLFDFCLSCHLFNRLHQRIFLCSVASAQRRPSRTWATLGIGPGNVQCDVIIRLLCVCMIHSKEKSDSYFSRHLGVTGALRFSWLWSFSEFLIFSASLSDFDLSSVFIAFFNLFFAWPCIGDVGTLDLGTWILIAWIKKQKHT